MGRRKKNSDPPMQSISQDIIDAVSKLWTNIQPRAWFDLLREIAPDNKWEMKGHSTILGLCPYHQEHKASFYLTFHRKMGKCFGCDKLVLNLVNLVAKLKNCSYTEALLFLNQRFDLGDVLGKNSEKLNEYNNVQEMKKWAAIAMNKVLEEVLRERPAHLAYCFPAVAYLVNARKIPQAALHLLPVGIYAKPEHLKKHIPDAPLHPLFDTYFEKFMRGFEFGALAFHYNDSPGTISRFKLRLLNREALARVENPADLVHLQVLPELTLRGLFDNKDHNKDMLYIPDPYDAPIGVFGLHRYNRMLGKKDSNAYVTEGEFDALSVMAAQVGSSRMDFIMLACGGKGATDLRFLHEYGIKTLWLVPDRASRGGNEWALSIITNKNNFQMKDPNTGFEMRVFMWPSELDGTDLDEAVVRSGYMGVHEYLFQNKASYFLNYTAWIKGLCDAELAKIKQGHTKAVSEVRRPDMQEEELKTRLKSLEDDRTQAMTQVISRWFWKLHDPMAQQSFQIAYATEESIDISVNAKVTSSMYALNTWEGSVAKVRDALREYFNMAYYRADRTTGVVHTVFSKKHECPVDLKLTDTGLSGTMATYIGAPIGVWLKTLLGPDNDIVKTGTGNGEKQDNDAIRRTAKDLMVEAWEGLYGASKNKGDLFKFGQGIHYRDLPNHVKAKNLVYFVNGKRIFRGEFVDHGQVEWARVMNIVDEEMIFEPTRKQDQWSHVEEVSDLRAGQTVDLRQSYDDLLKILQAWCLEHHETMSKYLAAYILSVPVMAAVGDVNITFITGNSQSGKTTLSCGLLGGIIEKHSGISVLEPVTVATDATTASVYQKLDRSTLMFSLDEAEGDEKHGHHKRNEDLMSILNSLPMGGVTVSRGGATGDQQVDYHMRMPVVLTAINLPADTVFLSRVVVINTVKQEKWEDPTTRIAREFPLPDVQQLRRNVTVGLLHRIPEILTRRNKLLTTLYNTPTQLTRVDNRFINCILTPLTIYEMLGEDPVKLYQDIINKYKDRLDAIHSQNKRSPTLDACLYAERIKTIGQDNAFQYASVRSLVLRGEFNILNNASCGVYYLEGKDWLVIVWKHARYAVLQGNPQFCYKPEASLREAASKCPDIIMDISPEDHKHLVHKLALADVPSPSEYSVVKLSYLLGTSKESEAAPGDASAGATGTVNEQPGRAPTVPIPLESAQFVM